VTDSEKLCWSAGFLEGEGTFSFYHTPRIRATQVQKEPLDRLSESFGGNVTLVSREYARNKGKKEQDSWQWTLGGTPAIILMFRLYPLMSRKRQEQISVALEDALANGGSKHLSVISDQIKKVS
jgi:hypothetical protein